MRVLIAAVEVSGERRFEGNEMNVVEQPSKSVGKIDLIKQSN